MKRVPIERAGRLLLALPFVLGGWEAAREPGPRVGQAAATGVPNPEMAVRANGIIMVIAGIALAFGRLPRWAAAVLALVLVPTTIAGHAFWKETESQKRTGQLTHFLKNVSMIGGLLGVVAGGQRG
ncbi:MAG TPA: DoxX family protein [Chloroflexota bacterium]